MDQTRGLYRKFNVNRVDGRDQPGGDKANAEYLVLDYANDPFGWVCAAGYVTMVAETHRRMSLDLARRLLAVLQAFGPEKRAEIDKMMSDTAGGNVLVDSEVYKLLSMLSAAADQTGVPHDAGQPSAGSGSSHD